MSSKEKKTASRTPLKIKDLRAKKNPKGGASVKLRKPDMSDVQRPDLMDSTL